MTIKSGIIFKEQEIIIHEVLKADIQRKLHQCNQGIEQTRVCRRENVCVFAEHQQRYQPFGQVLWHMSGIRKCKPERATETPWHSHQPMQNPCNRSVWCQNGTLPSNLQLLLKVAHRDTDNQNWKQQVKLLPKKRKRQLQYLEDQLIAIVSESELQYRRKPF